jgi:hypothetical protein
MEDFVWTVLAGLVLWANGEFWKWLKRRRKDRQEGQGS